LGVRILRDEDLDFAVGLTIAEGWNYTPIEIRRMLELDPEGSFIYEDGEPLGFITCVTYGSTGVLGHLIVSQKARRKKIGDVLMKSAIDYMEGKGVDSILLYATAEGAKLYERYGFSVRDEVFCIHSRLAKGFAGKPSERCAVLEKRDLKEVASMDRELFGDDRTRLLEMLYKACPSMAFKLEREGRIQGYIFARPDHVGYNLGPWACLSGKSQDSEDLFRTALSALSEEGILYWGVFLRNKEAMRFTEVLPKARTWTIPMMIRGEGRYLSDITKVFSLAAFELG